MEINYLLAAVLPLWCYFSSVLLICRHFLYICRSKGITGKELTPFMLQMLNELTDGKSLDSSILLLKAGGRGTGEGKHSSVLHISSDNSWWKTLSLYSQSSKGQTLQYLQTDESLATASCFFRSTLTVLILFCIKNWRPAQMAGGPEPKEIPHIWSLSLPALWWSLRTLLSMVGLHTGRCLSFPEHCTVHHTALSNSSWGCRVRETWEENPWVSRNPLAQARKKQIYWLGRQCRIWESWVHIQSLLPAL